ESVDRTDGSAHTKRHLHGSERSHRTQSITTDISEYCTFILCKCKEHTTVRTARAHHRRPSRKRLAQILVGRYRHTQLLRNQILRKLALHRKHVLAGHSQTQLLAVILDDRIQLLHDHKLIYFGSKIKNQFP